jgi:hypothetical protein
MAIPLGRRLPGASRDRPGRRRGSPLGQGAVAGQVPCRPYLVLLPVGFAVPPASPRARCALTAPFHPCRRSESLPGAGGLFSVALSLGSPPPGVTRHRASMEPGLSSPGPKKGRKRPSGRLARIEIRGAGGGVNLRAKVPDCQSRRAGLLSGRGAALVMPFV